MHARARTDLVELHHSRLHAHAREEVLGADAEPAAAGSITCAGVWGRGLRAGGLGEHHDWVLADERLREEWRGAGQKTS